jgi:hypothetical protein
MSSLYSFITGGYITLYKYSMSRLKNKLLKVHKREKFFGSDFEFFTIF